ncbi:hypothetical protein YC2023_118427 [Brassica napus]
MVIAVMKIAMVMALLQRQIHSILSFLFLVTVVVVEGFVLMMIIINQNLDFQGLRSVHPSSTRGLTQQHSVRNMLYEYIHGVDGALAEEFGIHESYKLLRSNYITRSR